MRYSAWEVVLVSDAVEAEIRTLPLSLQARYLRSADLLEAYGPQQLGMPHVRSLGGKLWELRMQGSDGIPGRFAYQPVSAGYWSCMYL